MRSQVVLQKAITQALLTAGILTTTSLAQTIPAFSGADGAARNVSGGRANGSGQIVYHVTSLSSAIDDPLRNNPGTIRYGLNSANFPAGVPRTIVFDVGGVFNLGRLPQAGWDPNGNGWDAQSRLTIGGSNVTLAGQTAPGAGVIFMGGGLKPQGNNNIIRNVTMASGYGTSGWYKPGDPFPAVPGSAGASTDPAQWFPDNTVYDAMDIAGTNLMIDHVSTIYATDETISMNEVANNITVQYSNISQGQNYPQWDAEGGGLTGHALGSLLSAGNTTAQAAISFHHNLYAHQKARVPQMQSITGSLGAYYDFRNNVFYNWFGTAGSKSGTTFLNLINNFYLAGDGGDSPSGGTNPGITTQGGGTGVISATSSIYRNGNLLDSNKDADANDGVALSAGGAANALWMGGIPTYLGTTDAAAQTFDRVLNYMGANWWMRDALINTPDERMINEARTGTGKIVAWADDPWNSSPTEGVEWQVLKNTAQTSRAADFDTEASVGYGIGDGMPTWWEIVHGLNPNARDDAGDFDADGYTNLEEYLNEVAEWPAPAPLIFNGTTNARYEQVTNWSYNWQPSKYDEAQIISGTVTINSVGQHARLLKIAPNAGNVATLAISNGWINVAEQLSIGAGGQVMQTGGLVLAPTLDVKGAYHFNGGEVTAGAVLLSDTGLLQMSSGGGKTLVASTISITNTAKLDVGDNKLIISGMSVGSLAGSAYNGVTGLIAAGHNGGTWNASGIITTQADALTGLTTLGIAPAADVLGLSPGETGVWSGKLVNASDTLVMYTYAGDANLDGLIDGSDYAYIDFSVAQSGVSGYSNGDFNFDGVIDGNDYAMIDFNITSQGGQLSVMAVPEPLAMGLSALAGLGLMRRRRIDRL